MKSPIKYFVWNKKMDFQRGSRYNLNLLSSGIEIADLESGIGVFYSRLLDACESGMEWHRLLMEGDITSEASIRFWIYASETPTLVWKETKWNIDKILQDETIEEVEKQELLKPFLATVLDNPQDRLLHEVKGRFLWFRIQLVAQEQVSPKITKIKIIFPKHTWLSYLPDVYGEHLESASFVERYLGMFQSLYEDMTDAIWKVPMYLNPNRANGAFLEWLAEWISIEDSYLWNEEQLRYLVLHGIELYKKRGTLDYLKEMVKLYTGKEPYIVEYHQLEAYLNQFAYAEKLDILYGLNSYIFTVIVDMDRQITNKEYYVLTRIIEQAKPAHMESNIIVLEPYIFLGSHSYLGINSVLSHYGTFVLDGQASIPFTTIENIEQ